MRGKRTFAIMLISLLVLASLAMLPVMQVGADLKFKSVWGIVNPHPTTGVRAYESDPSYNGDVYFYIQNRTNEGNGVDDVVLFMGFDMYDTQINDDLTVWIPGDEIIVVVEKDNGNYTIDHGGYIAFTNMTLDNVIGAQGGPTIEMQKIPAPQFVSNGTGYIEIDWTPLNDPNGIIEGYLVYRSTTNGSVAGDADWSLVGGSSTSPIVGGAFNDSGALGGFTYYYSLRVVFTGYQNDDPGQVDNYETQYFGEGSSPLSSVESILGIDFIRIEYANGTEVDTEYINIGKDTAQVFAMGYNSTGPTKVESVEVDWSVDLPLGTVFPLLSTSTTFTASNQGGFAVVTGENLTMGVSDTFNVSIKDPTVDYIDLTDAANGNPYVFMPWYVGDPLNIFASGYNNTGSTYVRLVEVDWTASPIDTGDGNFFPTLGTSSTFTGIIAGNVNLMGQNASMGVSDNFDIELFDLPATIDYVQINDIFGAGGVALTTVDLGVGESGTGYAAGYNGTFPTGTYVGPVDVDWSQLPDIGGTFSVATGSSSNYTADNVMWGTTTITGTHATYGADSFTLNVLQPTVDSIDIVDTAATGATTVPDQTVNVADIITGYAASFNITAGFIGDISVNWTVTPTAGEDASTLPLMGVSSVFDAGTIGGSVTWMADDLAGHTDSIIIDINAPEVDYIMIVDTDGTGSAEITDQTVSEGFVILVWAASFNDTTGYLGDITVTWTLENTSVPSSFITPLSGMNTTFTSGTEEGVVNLTADDGAGHNVTVVFTIDIVYTIDYITIVDTPLIGTAEILDQTVDVGFSIAGYAASFNDTAGYLGDVPVDWSVDAVGSTAPGSGLTSTFDAGLAGGAAPATWTADYMDGTHTDTVDFTVNQPTVDYIVIEDATGGTGNEFDTESYNVGDSDTFYCVGYNDTSGLYVEMVTADWAVTGGIGTVFPAIVTFTQFNATTAGSGTVTADYNGLTDATGTLTVSNVTDTTAPEAPVGLVVSQVAAGGALNLAWTANTEEDLDGYNVYRSTSATGTFTMLNTALLAGNTYSDTTVTEGTTYFYYVTAVDDSANESPDSTTAPNTADRDTDGDNTFNLQDDDDDGDTLTDTEEAALGTNPLLVDTDGDTHNDADDKYPLDATKWKDDDEEEAGFPIWIIIILVIVIILILLLVLMKKGKPAEMPPAAPEEEVPPPEEEVPPPEEEMPPEEEVPPPDEEVPPPEEEMPPEEEAPPIEEEAPPVEEDVPPPDEPAPPSEDEFPPPP